MSSFYLNQEISLEIQYTQQEEKVDEKEKKIIRVATANAHQFIGAHKEERVSKFVQFKNIIREDRVLINEYQRRFKAWLSEDQFDIVGLQEVFQSFRFFMVGVRKKVFEGTGFETVIPHGIGARAYFFNYVFENVLLSKLPLAEGKTFKDCNFSLPSTIYWVVRSGFTIMPVMFDNRVILVGNTHLHSSSSKKREDQVIHIAKAIKELQVEYGADVPILFMGDFNTVPKGAKASGFLTGDDDNYENDRTLEFLEDSVGLYSHVVGDIPHLYTYPAGIDELQPDIRCRTLDYILYSKHWEVLLYEVMKVYLSDHFPVRAEFRLT